MKAFIAEGDFISNLLKSKVRFLSRPFVESLGLLVDFVIASKNIEQKLRKMKYLKGS